MLYILRMNTLNFDLNLLRVFDMLLREQNVSRAAERLAVTQPTVSNALARLRDQFDDPLLVRVGRRMCPTPRALALEGPIRAALQQIAQAMDTSDPFDPFRSQRQLRLALTDYLEQLCMPRLLACLQTQAPNLRIDVEHLTPNLPVDALDRSQLDLVLGRFDDLPARFTRLPWRSETLRVATRQGHPQLNNGLDLNTFLKLRHLWVHGGQTRGMVDQWLAEQNLSRRIVYTTPNYLQAAHLVSSTDLCVVLPTQLALQFADLLPLDLHELPFALRPFELELVHLTHRQHDPALAWLVTRIMEIKS
ncbi:LysR family transcriptional regulator [Pseudomonas sp. S2_A02]